MPISWTVETMTPLVYQWAERVRRDVSRFEQLVPEAARAGTVLRSPATEQQIADAERRLGVQLPPSYRSFLLISNGAYASSVGAELAGFPRHGLLRVDELAPGIEAEPEIVELWTGIADFDDPERDRRPHGHEPITVSYYRPLKQAVLISRAHHTWREVLVPRAGDGEWELWSFEHDGALAFRSFADFLQWQVRRPDPRPTPDEADTLADAVRAGEVQHLPQLAELGDPRAAELAREVLDSDVVLRRLMAKVGGPGATDQADRGRIIYAARVLAKLRDPAAVEPLRRAYERAAAPDARIAALSALLACGAEDARSLVAHAAATDPDEQVRQWASRQGVSSGP